MNAVIRSIRESDILTCAEIACASPIAEAYGFTRAGWTMMLEEVIEKRESMLVVAEEGSHVLGFAWADPRGAFMRAPYLRFIAVDSNVRGGGAGSALLIEFEKRTSFVGRDYVLLVSHFNDQAIAFYERHGYIRAGELKDFAAEGITEIMMVKKYYGYIGQA